MFFLLLFWSKCHLAQASFSGITHIVSRHTHGKVGYYIELRRGLLGYYIELRTL